MGLSPPAPLLVFGWGNASRGDDALGPLFVQRLRQALDDDAAHAALAAQVECLEDYQLQPEHALDLVGRRQVLFVDASRDAPPPFALSQPQPARDASFSTHAMSPQALLQVFVQLQGTAPPPCTLLAIRGQRFDLGQPLGQAAGRHLDEALGWATAWVRATLGARG